MKLLQLFLFVFCAIYSPFSFADDAKNSKASDQKVQLEEVDPKYNDVMNEYRKYIETVPQDIRTELEGYRIKIAELNKSKKELYKKLSQEAQGYLKTEQKFKKKLPIKLRNVVEQDNKKDKK